MTHKIDHKTHYAKHLFIIDDELHGNVNAILLNMSCDELRMTVYMYRI